MTVAASRFGRVGRKRNGQKPRGGTTLTLPWPTGASSVAVCAGIEAQSAAASAVARTMGRSGQIAPYHLQTTIRSREAVTGTSKKGSR